MVTTPCITLSGSARLSASSFTCVPGTDLRGSDVFAMVRPRSLALATDSKTNGGGMRTVWTGEYCGTTVVETIDSTQVTARKPHALPGVSLGVLT